MRRMWRRLTQRHLSEDRLLALKRDMGLLGPAEAEAPKALEAAEEDMEPEVIDAEVEAVEITEADEEE